MQTPTQFHNLIVPPGKNTVEFKIIFTKQEYEMARDLCIKYGDPLWDQLSAETPVADRIYDLFLLMLRLERYSGPKEHEWKPGFFKEKNKDVST